MTTDAHLQKLLVDRNLVDTERVASALQGRIAVDGATGELVLGETFEGLRVEKKLLLLLLGRLASHLLQLAPDEMLSLKEVVDLSGLPRGSAAPVMRRLFQDRKLVAQASDKRYYIPRSKVIPVTHEVTND